MRRIARTEPVKPTAFYIALGTLLFGSVLVGCQRNRQGAVVIEPSQMGPHASLAPEDPFGASAGAYTKLREVTDAALAVPWSGRLAEFADWLENETVAIERSLGLLKALRVGPGDQYAVANARIAMLYDHIAIGLTNATLAAEAEGLEADWKGQQGRIWLQSSSFWARCVRGCSMSGTHLDAWDLHCRQGLANSQTQVERSPEIESPRQPY